MQNIWIDRQDYVRLACEFASVANYRFKGLDVSNGDYKINVALVNASLSIELFFKSILAKRKFKNETFNAERDGIKVVTTVHHNKLDQSHDDRTHKLNILFSRLPAEDASMILKASVNNLTGIKSDSDFLVFLDRTGNYFMDRRYPAKGVSFSEMEYLLAKNLIALTFILERIYKK